MNAANGKAAILLCCAASIGACDRWPSDPPRAPAPAISPAALLKAADAACRLPLDHFASSLRRLTGSILSPPYSRVMIDREGRILWNSQPVGRQRLGEYMAIEAAADERIFLLIYPEKEAPCAIVQETLAAAIEAGRCTPQRCAFEWPLGFPPPPPPPPLPDRALLLGNWLLASIDGASPPPGADPIELIFTDGAVGARSQCISYNWLIGVEAERLRLKTPPGPVAMCARATSPWEDRFGAAMAAAERIDSDGREMTVTGTAGKLKLKRPA
jgi:hypothetical protein